MESPMVEMTVPLPVGNPRPIGRSPSTSWTSCAVPILVVLSVDYGTSR